MPNLAKLHSVDSLLLEAKDLVSMYGHKAVSSTLRDIVSDIRKALLAETLEDIPPKAEIIEKAKNILQNDQSLSIKTVLNLTGTVLHTNLGRAALPASAMQAVINVATSYSNLEFNIEEGKRGDRDEHIESLILSITGAEAATIVNNNAAAVMLVLNTLAMKREVPVSRGELVEIGGSFRIPEVMQRSGCHLVEIGATNRTHAKDYEAAINDQTALLMKVHTSNYEIQGFTSNVSDKDIANIAKKHELPFVSDLGSGTLVDLRKWGLPYEPTVQETLSAGADVVTFSGDKLLGGPQCGLIVGKKDLIAKIKSNPMKRALRVDKMTIAALIEVLKLYLDPDSLSENLPTLKFLSRTDGDIKAFAESLLDETKSTLSAVANVELVTCESQIGSGSLPTKLLLSYAFKITPKSKSDAELKSLMRKFRALPVPIIGRMNDGSIYFDLRTLDSKDLFLEQLSMLKA